MKLRSLLWVPVVIAATFVFAAPAMAVYTGDGGVDVSDPTVSTGGTTTITSSGWGANVQVTLVLNSDPVNLGTFAANGSGVVTAVVTIPASVDAGSHSLVLTGTDPSGAPRTVTATLTVTSPSSGSLPRTGAALAALLGVAGILIAAGMVLSKARRRASTD